MSSYCLKCRTNTESINPRVSKTNNGKTMILSKCAIYGSKKSRFIKKQEASEILRNLGFKTPLNKILLFTKNEERIQKFKERGDTKYIYKTQLDKTCFQYGMAYGDFKDLARRKAYDKVLRNKAFNIARNPKYAGYLDY